MQIHFGYAENQHMPRLSGYGVNLKEFSFQLYFRSLSIKLITLTAFSSRPCLYCNLVVQYSNRLWCSVGVDSIISFWQDKQKINLCFCETVDCCGVYCVVQHQQPIILQHSFCHSPFTRAQLLWISDGGKRDLYAKTTRLAYKARPKSLWTHLP